MKIGFEKEINGWEEDEIMGTDERMVRGFGGIDSGADLELCVWRMEGEIVDRN